MNRAARQLLAEDADPRGRDFASLPFFSADPEATSEALRTAMRRCLEGERYRVAAHITLPDGEQRQLDFSLTPVMENGRTFTIVAEARDLLAAGEDA